MFEERSLFTLESLAAGIRDGKFTSEMLATQVIARSERFAALNAIISQDPECLLAAARTADRLVAAGRSPGPLHGVPVFIKDNINTRDYATSAGTPALEHDHPRKNATAITRLIDAGALIAGKTNLHELAVGGTSSNRHFGCVRNPWCEDMIAGGSSGGSAVVVAARIVPAALGTDTNGSVRGPCAFSGIAGFRPGFGRYPGDGIIPPTPTRDSIGVMATTVPDLMILDGIISGKPLTIPDVALAGLRLGRPRGDFSRIMDSRTAAVIDNAIALLEEHGAVIIDADIPDIAGLTARAAWAISAYEVLRDMPAYLAQRGTTITADEIHARIASPLVAERFMAHGDHLDGVKKRYDEAMRIHRPRLQQVVNDYFTGNRLDAIVMPTVPFPAPPIGEDNSDLEINGELIRGGYGTLIQNTVYQSACGIPSLTVPAGLADGLPVGISFDGLRGSDAHLLGIGREFERVREEFPLPPLGATIGV